jgi:transcriptional regulator with XRE-family HTH domain
MMTFMDQNMPSSALDPQEVIGDRVRKIREARGMTRDKLAATLQDMGIDWTRLTVNRLEIGRRDNITVKELLALCLALDIAPVDLLVPAHLSDRDYRVAPKLTARAENVREWLRGEDLVFAGPDPDPAGPIFRTPSRTADIAAFVQWMPEDRARRVARRYFEEEEEDQS